MISAANRTRLKIAVLSRHFGTRFGGAEHYSTALVEALANQHDIHVFAQTIEHHQPNIHYHQISRPFLKPRWINQLWFATRTWWLTRRGFDIVHSHETTWHGQIHTVHVRPSSIKLFHGGSLGRRVLHWLSMLTSPRLLAYTLLELSRFRNRPDRRIIASSTMIYHDILAAYPTLAPHLRILPPGVHAPVLHDRNTPTNKRQTQARLLQDCHATESSPATLALFVANDFEKKGLPALLKALTLLPNLHLAVAGSQASEITVFQKKAHTLGLADRVHFLGSLTDMSAAYAAADLLVHPTTEDSYAMVVLEAMAHGLPVIVSGPKFCGIAAELEPGKQALLLHNPGDPTEIATAIHRVLSDHELAAQLAKAGRDFAHNACWQKLAQRQNELYREVITTES